MGTGTLALRGSHAAEAIAAFSDATRLAPNLPESWSRLGAAFRLASEPRKAVEAYRHAVMLAPRDPNTHAHLAQALTDSSLLAEAQNEFHAASQLAPQDPQYAALSAVGTANPARTEPNYEQAVTQLRAAVANSARTR